MHGWSVISKRGFYQEDINPYAAGAKFGQYKMMQKKRVLSESYLMNNNIDDRVEIISKIFASLCFEQKKPQHSKG